MISSASVTCARLSIGCAICWLVHHQHLVGVGRVAQVHAHQEAVQLRLRQRERALVLDRVLRRQDHEGSRQVARHAVDGDAVLLHRLQQRRLSLRRCAVDLVGQHDLRHDRAGAELEVAALLVVDGNAGDVTGQNVRRELNALELAAGRLREAAGQHRLANAGHVLDQQMASAEQADNCEPYFSFLADNDLLNVVQYPFGDDFRVFHA